MKLSLFQGIEYLFLGFLFYFDNWFLTFGIIAQGLGVSLIHQRHLGIFAITFFL
jgi:hypothetical protein